MEINTTKANTTETPFLSIGIAPVIPVHFGDLEGRAALEMEGQFKKLSIGDDYQGMSS